ncbi:MAG: penicillin-binding protein 2 [Candidatus Portnoybacteria bacterium CG10_big_fil_rev_8_21_14_0_10_38_18]|uniref:Penicillin-binding protein 2 n=1 Tax=Candidatus Portnoybacteria bacterium CG10_big_fil_rev_8_21_14_0_10_38_18 TaxID=1974813 RepID=A0A2M8KCV6_9BACT|nr:MAG: penicillin-binding protein 2 [Candidatus Portnoybacteria bacterium CG10_big_fil_rev_8_21_14_0_10_38_18]
MKNWRFYTFVFFIGLIFLVVIFRLFTLQILKHSFYKTLAANQHQSFQTIYPSRGEIFMKDEHTNSDSPFLLFPVAINKDFWTVYAVPKEIENKEETVEKLSPLLGVEEETLKERIEKTDDPYEPLKNKVDEDTVNGIKEFNLEGIHFESENWRYFPASELACHVIGFVGFDGDKKVGRYGIEGYYQEELAGKPGFVEAKKDSLGQLISVGDRILAQPEEGVDLVLTIDPNVQFFVEGKLKETIERLEAPSGTIIVMEVKTGAIKAMASWPTFNPNKYNEVKNINLFLNPAIYEAYEPGSIFKPITMAAALDKEVIEPNTTYEDKGFTEVAGRIIKNALDRAEGIQTMTQVLEKSLNSGAIFAEQRMEKDDFKKYIQRFGFGQKTGIDLSGEEKGNVSNLDTKGDVEYATISFGQGIAVTSIQLIAAFSAIANDGILMKPYVVEKIIYKNGEEEITKPKEIRRVISSETASRLSAMMVSVVKNGYSKKAAVPGYLIAGKTGTAQIPDFEKGGYTEETIHTFGEFFPALNPQFSVLIKVDKPKGINFASESIAPLARQIAEYILNYYEIPPTQ